MRARVQVVLVLVGLLTLGLSSCNLLPFGGGGGGGGGGGYVQPAMSPYMNAQDLSDYQEGRWVHHKTEVSGTTMESTIKVVGKEGENLWIEVGNIVAGSETTHLLLVQPDRKVVKAFFAGKDAEKWAKCDISEIDQTPAAGGETPDVEIKESDESKTVPAGDFACHRIDTTVDGKTSTMWYSKDIFKLTNYGSEHGGIVAMESGGMVMVLVGMGADAKPHFDIPKDEE